MADNAAFSQSLPGRFESANFPMLASDGREQQQLILCV